VFLASCHNRHEKTFKAVSDIDCQIQKLSNNYLIILVDCSTNSITRDKINLQFPNCKVIIGSNEWYWAAAMVKGYDYIKENGINFDYLIPFNDDIKLFKNSLQRCISELESIRSKHLIYSACFEDGTGNSTYGGRRSKRYYSLKFYNLPPIQKIQKVDVVNMNLTFITKNTINKIGFFDPIFQHSLADFDYSLTNLKSKGTNYISSFYAGICENNDIQNTSKDSRLSVINRLRKFNSVKEQPFRIRFHYFRKHFNLIQLILFFPLSYLSIVFNSFLGKLRL
jgi:GT2 family glycosyltransferase